jgi:hypothetical protein
MGLPPLHLRGRPDHQESESPPKLLSKVITQISMEQDRTIRMVLAIMVLHEQDSGMLPRMQVRVRGGLSLWAKTPRSG